MKRWIRRIRRYGGNLLATGFLILTLIICFLVSVAYFRNIAPKLETLPWEHAPASLVDTVKYFEADSYPYLPRDVVLSDLLKSMAPQYGFVEYDIQAMIAASAWYSVQPEHVVALLTNLRWEGGIAETFLPSLAVAQFLVENGYHDQPPPCPTQIPLPPTPEEEAPEAAECIPINPKHEAIKAFNPAGGEAFLSRVLATAGIWAAPVQTASIVPTEPDTIVQELSVFIEIWRLREEGLGYYELVLIEGGPVIIGPGQPPIPYPDLPDGYFVHPYAGSSLSGYCFGCPVYVGGKTVIHPGVDLNGRGGAVVAACNGRVTYAGWMNSASLWISGIVVAIECFPAETDPTPICTLYGHGAEGSLKVGKGEVKAGDWLFDADSTGFSSGTHLHYDIRIGGGGPYCNQSIDPMPYLP